jgi:hypothetical protein
VPGLYFIFATLAQKFTHKGEAKEDETPLTEVI